MALKRKKWKGNERCVVCDVPETVDHIFFVCPIAKFAWGSIKRSPGGGGGIGALNLCKISWSIGSLQDVDNMTLKSQFWATVMWALWNARNKMAIEGVFIRSPNDIIFRINFFLQRWKVLLRGNVRAELETWDFL